MKPNIKELTLKAFEAELVERKEPSYRGKQVWQWLFQKRAASFAEMTNLSSALRARLTECARWFLRTELENFSLVYRMVTASKASLFQKRSD